MFGSRRPVDDKPGRSREARQEMAKIMLTMLDEWPGPEKPPGVVETPVNKEGKPRRKQRQKKV
jgi:hypothetical protein